MVPHSLDARLGVGWGLGGRGFEQGTAWGETRRRIVALHTLSKSPNGCAVAARKASGSTASGGYGRRRQARSKGGARQRREPRARLAAGERWRIGIFVSVLCSSASGPNSFLRRAAWSSGGLAGVVRGVPLSLATQVERTQSQERGGMRPDDASCRAI